MENYSDVRKNYMMKILELHHATSSKELAKQSLDNACVDQFFDDPECMTLSVYYVNSKFVFSNQIVDDYEKKNLLVFYKSKATAITDKNISSVLRICSLENPALGGFYNVLQNVYIPALFKDDDTVEDIKLRILFENVEAGLKNAMIKKNVVEGSVSKQFNINGILSLKDECEYWDYIVQNSRDPNERKRAGEIFKILQPLENRFSQLLQIHDLDEFVEDAYNAFDDLWKLDNSNFPEERMTNLLEIIGNAICYLIQTQLKKTDLWNTSFYETNELLLTCTELCNKWLDTCVQLTTILWPHHASHPWMSGHYEPKYTKIFLCRLNEIMEIRNVHHVIRQILSPKEEEELKITDAFHVFSRVNVIQCNPYTDHLWQAARNSFNEYLKTSQEYVGRKIKEKFKSSSNDVLQMLEWFKRYRNLLHEKSEIRNMLRQERQNLLVLLRDYIHDLPTTFGNSDDAASRNFSENLDLPEIIVEIIRVKETRNKIKEIENQILPLLDDLTDYDKVKDSVSHLRKELQSTDTGLFNKWSSATVRALSKSELSLKTEDPVVYFEENKLMTVNYNPKLVQLIKEVHHFHLLGYNVPSTIVQLVDKAKLFMKQAKALEQVANFHNTIGDRMIPSQRPMMLTLAMELSKLVKQENSVTWSDKDAVDQYISKLQHLVDELGSANHRLYFYHSQIVKKVARLFDVDLVLQKKMWKDVLREIRGIIADVTTKFSNTKTWLIHWDHQIYKALQYQYQSCLLDLNKHLPEMKIELVYRQRKLQFNPPFEEIKMRYYDQVKQFLMLPLTFRGVSDTSESIFPVMVVWSADRFQQVYMNAEHVFQKLLNLKEQWVDRTALGAVDLESITRDHLKTAEDWELNFRTSKAWGQEIAKIIDCEHKIECFTVSTAPVRSEIELHNNRYWDTLSVSLYASISVDANLIEDFINGAKKRLEYQPQTCDEIGEASETYLKMMRECKEMKNAVQEMDEKNRVLSSWTKESVGQVAEVKNLWNNFHALLDNQQFYINRQIESIKTKLIADAENLSSELEKFVLRWQRLRPKETDLVDGSYAVIDNNLTVLKEKREEWNQLSDNIRKIRRDYERFGIDAPAFPGYEDLEKDLTECEEIWGLYEKFEQGLQEFCSEEWTIFRSKSVNKFEAFISEWERKLEDMTITPLIARLMSDLRKKKDFIPQIKYLRGDIFSSKHWSELCAMLQLKPKSIEKLTFGDFLSAQDFVLTNINSIQELNNRAASEAVIRQALAELDIWEVESKFSFISHTDSKGKQIYLIKDFKDILSKIGDNQCLLKSMIGTPNYDQYVDHISMWEAKLMHLDFCLRNLSEAQRKWLYLEPIFKSETMKVEKARFERIDKDVHFVLETLYSGDQRVIGLNRIQNLRSTLETLVQQLNICQKSLNEYLEEKRLKFPRFYFLSDDDLLEILGQANKPDVVQSHLKKLFAGINCVVFDQNNIVSVQSQEGETVRLRNPVTISLDVENWLNTLSTEMNSTLKQLLKACLKEADPLRYPSQILDLAESISFTARSEDAIKSGKLSTFLSSLQKQLDTYTKLDSELEDGDDSRVLELKLKALIFDTVYHINIVQDLIANTVSSIDEWNWQKRVRFYLAESEHVVIRMADAQFSYSFEYQGNAPKLVHTPLTDRCYLTLTQAMSMGLGGNPYGPAGTGKTESVKALGRLFGRQVLVFNCDEGLDITSLTRILIGLVKCGAWGCFDEFNRLEEATLSAVSTHIHVIQEALRNGVRDIRLMNREVSINANTGIFVTMNPAGRAYGGRQKLPTNLKQLFRPIAMSVPDDLQIAEVILHSEGFQNAKLIAKKLVQIFDIAKKILSQQKHYDWGLRALKTVIGGCKTALKATRLSPPSGGVDEMALVVQTLRLNTLSKLTYNDARQFDALISSTFRNVELSGAVDNRLSTAVEESFALLNLQHNPRQVQKCLELYEQIEQRMGVVIVGPAGSGKSTVRELLRQALIGQKRSVNQYIINPKSMPRTQLLGHIDQDTRQWVDGVLSIIAQRVYNEPADVESWIVFDGDIDPEWIESLNSVLDDNRLLTLPSGWRIHFGSNVHFVFETHSLQYASPATVSRMGIILMSGEDMNIECVVRSWLEQQSELQRLVLGELIETYFYKSVAWIQEKGETTLTISSSALVKNCLSLMDNVQNKTKLAVVLIHGLGSSLTLPSKEAFAKQVLEWTSEFLPDTSQVLGCYYDETRATIDCYASEFDETASTVKTARVKVYMEILKIWLNKQRPIILSGPQGCGKKHILEYCMQERSGVEIVTIYGSAQLTPTHILQKLSQICMTVTSNNGAVFRPKSSTQLIVHLKDINLAYTDKWGTNILAAFLQQVLTYNGFYDPIQKEWVLIERVQFICSLISCDSLSPRFVNCNHLLTLWPPEQADLHCICSSYLKPMTLNTKLRPIICSIMSEIYSKVKETLVHKTDYEFNLRDLCSWCTGLKRYSVKTNQEVIQALLYECDRLFRDRLVSKDDKDKFASIVKAAVESELGHMNAIEEINEIVYASESSANNGDVLQTLKLEDWIIRVDKYISLLENEGEFVDKKMLLPELAKTVAYFERVLTLPGGSLLLLGHSGYGRKSAVRIVAARQAARLFSPKVSSTYGLNHFKSDVKSVLQQAGLENQTIYFVLEDFQMVHETMIHYVNSLLASGEIPGLYQSEEFETVCAPLREVINQFDFQGTVCQFFTERVMKNIHLIIVTDFELNESASRWINDPIVRRRCQTILLPDWSIETKKAVLRAELKTNTADSSEPSHIDAHQRREMDDGFLDYFLKISRDVESWMTGTPRHFTLFARTFLKIKDEKETSILDSERKFKAGVSKLTEAKEIVAQLKEDAAQQESKLAEKQSKANAALELITKTMQSASSQKTEMESLKGTIEKESEALSMRKKQIDAELAEVEPILAEAQSAVGNIKSEALSEIRSLRAPPDVIHDILEGVLRLMGIQDTSWNSMKTFLAKRGVKEDIRCFDARNIYVENRVLVEDLLRKREKSFEERTAKRASAAAAPLAAWVIANVKYSQILEKIRPLETEQNKLHEKLKRSENEITLLSSELDDVSQSVQNLKEQLNVNTKEAAEIEIHLSKVQNTISAAEGLVVKLDEEYSRWSERVVELSIDLTLLMHNCLLSSAIIVYLSHSSEEIRKSTLKKWQQMLELDSFQLEKFLSSEQEQLKWLSEGLPSDYMSVQNAIIISQLSKMDLDANLTPLVIDPSDTALKWLESLLKKSKTVDTISLHDPKFHTSLELAIRFGKALIVRDLVSVDPILVPILRRNYTFQGTRKLIPVGDKLVDCNADFKLYLITQNSKSDLKSYFTTLLSSINFEITHPRLSQQLLRCALTVEKPELEKRRIELLKREDDLKLKLFALQDDILIELANAQGNVLENKELLATLNETKKHSAEINTSLKESEKLQAELLKEYEVYKALTERAATLYFSILSLKSINNFYQISMDSFISIYQSIFSSEQEAVPFNVNEKLQKLVQNVYSYICRFLFKEDVLTFALHLVYNMCPFMFQDKEWELFNREILVDVQANSPQVLNSVPPWASKENAFDIYLLKRVIQRCVVCQTPTKTHSHSVTTETSTLPTLYEKLDVSNEKLWVKFMKSESYSLENSISISLFQHVLVVQAFKPGFLYSQLSSFVLQVLGLRSLTPNSAQLEKVERHTSAREPILIIISPGVDPSDELRSLAKVRNRVDYKEIALGRGQADEVVKLLHECAQNGTWLILKNLHLMTSWLSTLEKEMETLRNVHDDFRLWLTSEPHVNFSSTLIKKCLKITYETPPGFKRNLERTYGKLMNESFSSTEHARTMFVLSWFHAILQERRTYIPQGWCKFYEFNDSDLFTSANVIRKRFKSDNKNMVKWNYVHGLLEQAIYGGRVDNDQDLKVLVAYLDSYFNNEVITVGRKSLGSSIHMPQSSNAQEFLNVIQKLPDTNAAQFFNLPLNVDLSWQKKRSADIIGWLKILRRQSVTTEKLNVDEWKKKISPVLHLWKQLNQEVGIIRLKPTTDERTEDDPVRRFLAQELNFGITLVNRIHKTLVGVNKIIRAPSTINDNSIPLIMNVVNQRTPDDWLTLWEGSWDLIVYVRSAMSRASAIMKLKQDHDTVENFISKTVDLKHFFNPQTFLSIFKHYSSRLNEVSLDELQMECTWTSYIPNAKVTLTIENIHIEGASVNTSGALQENSSDSPVSSKVPNLKVAWVPNKSQDNRKENIFQIPVYDKPTRNNILMFVRPSIIYQEHDKWTQMNPALYLPE